MLRLCFDAVVLLRESDINMHCITDYRRQLTRNHHYATDKSTFTGRKIRQSYDAWQVARE